MKTTPPKKIALVLNKDRSTGRKVIRGLLSFEPARTGWVLHTINSVTPSNLERLERWQPDGVVLGLDDAELPPFIRATAAVVDVSEDAVDHGEPCVLIDQHRVGQLAAEHFIDRGFRSFAYFGDLSHRRSRGQWEGFGSRITAALPDTAVHLAPPLPTLDMSKAWTSADDALATWLAGIPRPFGLMLSDDEWGLWLLQVCHSAELRVPEDVAILGVNDDSLNCEMTTPPLTSVQVPLGRVGEEAARLLHALMNHEPLAARAIVLKPTGITVRQSTHVIAVSDEQLAAAVRFIEGAAHRAIGVEDILDHVPISRRSLERRFREHLGRSPLQEIRRAHVERAKLLLATTDRNLQEIADYAGFATTYHLCRTFKKETGDTAIAYRRNFRRGRTA